MLEQVDVSNWGQPLEISGLKLLRAADIATINKAATTGADRALALQVTCSWVHGAHEPRALRRDENDTGWLVAVA